MTHRTFCLIAGAIFAIVALLHLTRLVMGWEAVLAGWTLPLWISGIGLAVAGTLAYYGLRLGTRD